MKELFTHNTKLKLLALLVSLFLWFFVTIKGQSEIIIELPIEFKNLPEGFQILSTSANDVQVKLKGDESVIKSLSKKDVSVFIDLSGKTGEDNVYYINKDNIKLPLSLSVNKITPPYVIVALEKTVQKILKVNPIVTGKPKEGYHIDGIKIFPQTVKLEGSEKAFKGMDAIDTEAIDITDLDSGIEQYIFLNFRGGGIHSQNEKVKVKVMIDEDKSATALPVRPALKGTIKENYRIKEIVVTPKKVIVEGPISEVSALKFISTKPIYIDNMHSSFEKDVFLNLESKDLSTRVDKVNIKIKIITNGEQ